MLQMGGKCIQLKVFLPFQAYCIQNLGFKEAVWNEQAKKEWIYNLEFGHPRCVCNNEVKYNEGQNTTKFLG